MSLLSEKREVDLTDPYIWRYHKQVNCSCRGCYLSNAQKRYEERLVAEPDRLKRQRHRVAKQLGSIAEKVEKIIRPHGNTKYVTEQERLNARRLRQQRYSQRRRNAEKQN